MARPRRVKFSDPEAGAYHIISRALQKQFILQDSEKQKFLSLFRWLSTVYFVRVGTFSIMTNHIHLIVKMIRKSDISEAELRRRFDLYYNQNATPDSYRELEEPQIPHYYARFSDISCFMQDLKQRFSRWYNEQHNGYGHVWADRFKSVLLVGSTALRACMIYVELNALRAGIVREPEKYRFSGLYHYLLKGRHSTWLDHALLREMIEGYDAIVGASIGHQKGHGKHIKGVDIVSRYLAIVYQEGLNLKAGKASIKEEIWQNKMQELPEEVLASVYLTKIPQLTNGIVLGSKEECEAQFREHKTSFRTKNDRKATPVFKQKKKGEGKAESVISTLIELCSLRSTSMIL